MAVDERAILESHMRSLLGTRRSSYFRRRRIRKAMRFDLYTAGRTPKRAKWLARHMKAEEKRIRRGYLLDNLGHPNLDTAVAKAVERVLRRVPKRYG